MTISLATFANGDVDYVTKLNDNVAAEITAITALQSVIVPATTTSLGLVQVDGTTLAVNSSGIVSSVVFLINRVTYSVTPVFNLSLGSTQYMKLTGDATISVQNPIDGWEYTFMFAQDTTGGHTVTWPSSFKGVGSISPSAATSQASTMAIQKVVYDGSSGNFYGVGTLNYNM